jgi:DNA polymerase-3 subunit delta
VADEPLAPVYLLGGSDRPKIARALARLRGRFEPAASEMLTAETASGEDAVAACNALGLLGASGGRLVIVEAVERWRADDVAAVAAYLINPVSGAVLALVADEPPKSPALAEACARAGQVLVFDIPKPKDPAAWVRAEFARLGASADDDATRVLVDLVGRDVSLLAVEIEKIATWAAGAEVTRADVAELAVPAHEEAAWALTDAWGARDLATVLAAAEAELERGVEPFLVAARLAGQVALVRAVQLLAGEGLGARDVAKRRKKHEFRVRKALAHAENYTAEELDAAVVRLAALDAALKGASRVAGELELERALVEVTRRAELSAGAERN